MNSEPVLNNWDASISISKPKLVMKISTRILERYPVEEKDVERLFDPEELVGGNSEEVFKLCKFLIHVWKYAIYHQPKPEKFTTLLSEHNFPEGVVRGVVEAFQSEVYYDKVEKLAGISFSTFPRVKHTDWVSQSVVCRNGEPSTDRQVILTFSTDQGQQKLQLTSEELEKLYWTNNDIQKSLDKLLER